MQLECIETCKQDLCNWNMSRHSSKLHEIEACWNIHASFVQFKHAEEFKGLDSSNQRAKEFKNVEKFKLIIHAVEAYWRNSSKRFVQFETMLRNQARDSCNWNNVEKSSKRFMQLKQAEKSSKRLMHLKQAEKLN